MRVFALKMKTTTAAGIKHESMPCLTYTHYTGAVKTRTAFSAIQTVGVARRCRREVFRTSGKLKLRIQTIYFVLGRDEGVKQTDPGETLTVR